MHAASAAAHDVFGTYGLTNFVEFPSLSAAGDGMEGEPHGFRQAVLLLAERGESYLQLWRLLRHHDLEVERGGPGDQTCRRTRGIFDGQLRQQAMLLRVLAYPALTQHGVPLTAGC